MDVGLDNDVEEGMMPTQGSQLITEKIVTVTAARGGIEAAVEGVRVSVRIATWTFGVGRNVGVRQTKAMRDCKGKDIRFEWEAIGGAQLKPNIGVRGSGCNETGDLSISAGG